ncbi:glycosyl hydrolase family 31 family protein [Dorcoceras hygrometricum]|uniref:Glycosyl hydrolase family 31 family protein n=1 Tax=Dorcoceras hygrometricum TaxID=472368 RepID=A0A2Z7D0V4_9LAMI|nr:glycosyl hydrolase family 31 family protein [Dorcoceras hygrometricum]
MPPRRARDQQNDDAPPPPSPPQLTPYERDSVDMLAGIIRMLESSACTSIQLGQFRTVLIPRSDRTPQLRSSSHIWSPIQFLHSDQTPTLLYLRHEDTTQPTHQLITTSTDHATRQITLTEQISCNYHLSLSSSACVLITAQSIQLTMLYSAYNGQCSSQSDTAILSKLYISISLRPGR